jgi:ubiquitin C-terminal hydrolase
MEYTNNNNIQEIFNEAIQKYSIVPDESKDEIIKAKKNLKKFINEELIFDSTDGITCVTTDPKEEFDDLVMLRFGVYNITGTCILIISAGYFSYEERFDYLKTLFDCFKGAEFDKEFKTPKGGTLIFKKDGCDISGYKIKRFINCGPCSSITLNSIKFDVNPIIITVGANDDGTTNNTGINQKQTDTEGTLNNIPDVWDNFIEKGKQNKAIIKNMSINVTRYVLFKNPTKYDKDSSFYKELTKEEILNAMIKSTAMFLISRPLPKFNPLRVNEGNSIIDIQLYSDFSNATKIDYYRGLDKFNEYIELTKQINSDEETKKNIYKSAAIPIMITNCIGGVYKEGQFGFGPADKIAKETLGCLTPESAEKVIDYIRHELNEFTPAYDPLAFIEAFNYGKKIVINSKNIYRVFKSEKTNEEYFYDVINDYTTFKKPTDLDININKISKDWVLKESKTYKQLYFYNKKTHKSQWTKPIEYKYIEGLNWIGNSCYLDSVIMCLFLIPNKYINNEILFKKDLENRKCTQNDIKNIQKSLKDIVLSIRGTNVYIEYCTDLRKQIKNCISVYDEKFHLDRTNDSGEFLYYLFDLFNVNTCEQNITNYIYDNKSNLISTNSINNKISPIITIDSSYLKYSSFYNIIEFINTESTDDIIVNNGDEKNIKAKKVETTTYNNYPFIVFNVHRKGTNRGKQTFFANKLTVPKEFTNLNDETFELYGIVIHDERAHYVAMLKLNDDNWVFYNDIAADKKIEYIGSYDRMIEYKYKNNITILTHGTLYFYSKIEK